MTLESASVTKMEARDLAFTDIADIRSAKGMALGTKVAIGSAVGASFALTALAILAAALR